MTKATSVKPAREALVSEKHTALPWTIWVELIADAEQAKKELGLLVEGTPDLQPHLVYLCGPDNLAPAVTGCGEKSIANAELIVTAVNSHAALVKALEEAKALAIQYKSDLRHPNIADDSRERRVKRIDAFLAALQHKETGKRS